MLEGIALASVFHIIISEVGQRSREGQSPTRIAEELSRDATELRTVIDAVLTRLRAA